MIPGTGLCVLFPVVALWNTTCMLPVKKAIKMIKTKKLKLIYITAMSGAWQAVSR